MRNADRDSQISELNKRISELNDELSSVKKDCAELQEELESVGADLLAQARSRTSDQQAYENRIQYVRGGANPFFVRCITVFSSFFQRHQGTVARSSRELQKGPKRMV